MSVRTQRGTTTVEFAIVASVLFVVLFGGAAIKNAQVNAGGIGSHCTPETPGYIHEGGELGYSLSHAFGAAFDNPDLLVTLWPPLLAAALVGLAYCVYLYFSQRSAQRSPSSEK